MFGQSVVCVLNAPHCAAHSQLHVYNTSAGAGCVVVFSGKPSHDHRCAPATLFSVDPACKTMQRPEAYSAINDSHAALRAHVMMPLLLFASCPRCSAVTVPSAALCGVRSVRDTHPRCSRQQQPDGRHRQRCGHDEAAGWWFTHVPQGRPAPLRT